jgi:hypothetical protein
MPTTSVPVDASPNPGPTHRVRVWWGWQIGLGLVALGLALVHILVVGLDRPLGWDEAVLYTQVVPDVPSVFMEPHRTRGVSLLVAPIAVFDPSMVVLRSYLVVAAAIGLFAAFATWFRTIGGAAVLAAALFASFWVTFFYDAEVLPNLPTALLAVAAGGMVAEVVTTDEVRRPVPYVLGAVFLVFALVRPPEAALTGLVLAVLVLLYRRQVAVKVLTPSAIGGAIGVGAWFVEGYVRFGFSPRGTFASAAEYSVDGERFNQLPVYLASLEDRLRCTASCLAERREAGIAWEPPPARTSVFLLALALAALLAFVAGRQSRRPALVASAIAVPILALYGYSAGAMNLRYLMPVYAVGFIAAAAGAGVLWRVLPRDRWGVVARTTLLLPVAAVLVWQTAHGAPWAGEEGGARDRAAALGAAVQPYLDGGPCAIGTVVNYPQVQYWTRCEATRIVSGGSGELQAPLGELASYVDLSAAAEEGHDVLAIVRADPPAEHPVASWELLEPHVETYGEVFEIRRWREGDPIPPPPCPEGGGERQLAQVLSTHCP